LRQLYVHHHNFNILSNVVFCVCGLHQNFVHNYVNILCIVVVVACKYIILSEWLIWKSSLYRCLPFMVFRSVKREMMQTIETNYHRDRGVVASVHSTQIWRSSHSGVGALVPHPRLLTSDRLGHKLLSHVCVYLFFSNAAIWRNLNFIDLRFLWLGKLRLLLQFCFLNVSFYVYLYDVSFMCALETPGTLYESVLLCCFTHFPIISCFYLFLFDVISFRLHHLVPIYMGVAHVSRSRQHQLT
jgi:hypothetical protein